MEHERPAIQSDEGEARAHGRARRGGARALAFGLQTLAVGAAAVAAAREGLPSSLGTVVLLLVAAALCVNRQALFPGEISVTAEASVIVCAVVLFRHDAPVLAPMIVGLASGWLDSYQWASRAWVPMAFNSGNRGMEALLAALSFQGVTHLLGSSPGAVAGAAVVAAAVFCAVDNVVIVMLVVVRDGVAVRRAVGSVISLDRLGIPIALLGAGAGLLGLATATWVGALAVLPAAWVLETLVIGRSYAPRRRLLLRVIGGVLSIACAFAIGSFVGLPPFSVTVALVVLGLLAGFELAVDRRRPVPPALGAVVVLGVGSVVPSHATVAALLVAVTAASVSWSFERGVPPSRFVTAGGWVVGAAVGAGLLAQAGAPVVVVVAAFSLAALAAAPRRATAIAIGFTLPLLVIGASSAELRAWAGPLATLVAGGAVLAVAALVIAWNGAPPWRSRLAERTAGRSVAGGHRLAWSTGAGGAVMIGVVALVAPSESVAVVGLAVVVEVVAALALTRVRLWRFRIRRRACEITMLSVAVALAWWASSSAGREPRLALAMAGTAAAIAFTIGWSTVAIVDQVAIARHPEGDEVSR